MSERVVPGSATPSTVTTDTSSRGTRLVRSVLVILLVLAAYLAIQPWLSCAAPLGQFLPDAARICAFGSGSPAFDQTGGLSPMWWRLVLAAMFAIAAGWVAFTRRLKFD